LGAKYRLFGGQFPSKPFHSDELHAEVSLFT
jgi:hypothetical protein